MAMAMALYPQMGIIAWLRPAKIKLGDPNAPGPVKLIVPSLPVAEGQQLMLFFERSLDWKPY